jgi:rubrerythrin
MIKGLYGDLLPDGPGDPVKGYPIFEKKKKESGGKLPDLSNEHEVLQRAIGDEIEARDFYRRVAKSFESQKAKEVFLDLMEMEEGHIRLLQAELDYLEKTGFYFDHMEFTVEGERD